MFISLPICIKLVYYQISRCRLFPPQPMAAAYFFITHFITGSEFIGEYLLISRKHFDMIDHIKNYPENCCCNLRDTRKTLQ